MKRREDEKSWTTGLCTVPCPWCAVLAPRVHQLKCDRRPTNCTLCGFGCTLAGLAVHMEKCPAKTVRCPGCQQSMSLGVLDEHLVQECNSRSFVCPDCSEAFWILEEFKAHLDPQCPRRLVACQLCTSLVPGANLAAHYLECSNRQLRRSQHMARNPTTAHNNRSTGMPSGGGRNTPGAGSRGAGGGATTPRRTTTGGESTSAKVSSTSTHKQQLQQQQLRTFEPPPALNSTTSSFGGWEQHDDEEEEDASPREDARGATTAVPAATVGGGSRRSSRAPPTIAHLHPERIHSPLRPYRRPASSGPSIHHHSSSPQRGSGVTTSTDLQGPRHQIPRTTNTNSHISTTTNKSLFPGSSANASTAPNSTQRATGPVITSLKKPQIQVKHLRSGAYRRTASPEQEPSMRARHQDPSNSAGHSRNSRETSGANASSSAAASGASAVKGEDQQKVSQRGRSSSQQNSGRRTSAASSSQQPSGTARECSQKRSHSQGSARSTGTVNTHHSQGPPIVRKNLVQESLEEINRDTLVESQTGRRFGTLPKKEQEAVLYELKMARLSANARRTMSPAPRNVR